MRRIELESMRDLAYLASGPHSGIIQHYKTKTGDNFYFLIGGTMRETFIYYVKSEDVTKKFICLDTSKDKVEYTDSPILNPRTQVIPIIKIKKQDLLELE